MMRHLVWIITPLLCSLKGAELNLEFCHQWDNEPITLEDSQHSANRNVQCSLSRIAYLISGLVLIDSNKESYRHQNYYGLIDLEAGRTTLNLTGLPARKFQAIEFTIGLETAINQSDPSQFPPKHPLNPIKNKLHWNWQEGYIFLALEGHWKTPQANGGFSYHLGNAPHRMRIKIPATIDLTQTDVQVALNFDLAQALKAITFQSTRSTHGRPGDSLAMQIKNQTEGAFKIARITTVKRSTAIQVTQIKAQDFVGTPYPFKVSQNVPIPDLPRDYPLTVERVELGRRLFHDASLSRNNSVSCVTCHQSEHAFADDQKLSTGIDNQIGRRNTMPLVNLAWKDRFFWDGRAYSLREQALISIENETEMDASLPALEQKLAKHPAYPSLFKNAFGTRKISAEHIGVAIEQFLLTQTSFNSKFDQAVKGGTELSELEKRGLELFFTEYDPRRQHYGADCFHCHGGPLFTDQAFHNNGLSANSDLGLAEITNRNSDIGKFSTPTLRNINETAPYMHDGRFATLEAVIQHYREGIHPSSTLDPNLAKHSSTGIPLSDADSEALIAFLKALSDEKYTR